MGVDLCVVLDTKLVFLMFRTNQYFGLEKMYREQIVSGTRSKIHHLVLSKTLVPLGIEHRTLCV